MPRPDLLAEAAATGFDPEALEKVIHLLGLLDAINRHPFLARKLALKGGTALNLFIFDVPRLSVDIDLNYVGAAGREAMLTERPQIIEAISEVCTGQGLTVRKIRQEHAGCTWLLRYDSALSQRGSLKVDLNFMFRIPLWPAEVMTSRSIGTRQVSGVLVMDLHELAAGKLAALLSRRTSRDLFDAYELLVRGLPDRSLDPVRLRLALLVYGAINRVDWRTVTADGIGEATQDIESYLLPLLKRDSLESLGPPATWGARLVQECQKALGAVLPLTVNERTFLERLLEHGEIDPSLVTQNADLAERIRQHPGLAWKALNVKNYRSKNVDMTVEIEGL
jgi:predicted nucleotidyltransferase component of viral defense system